MGGAVCPWPAREAELREIARDVGVAAASPDPDTDPPMEPGQWTRRRLVTSNHADTTRVK